MLFRSFAFVGFVLEVRDGTIHSLQIAAMGWLGPIQLQFAWYANPFLIAGFVFVAQRKSRKAVFSAIAAALLSLNTATLFWQGLLTNENGFFAKATSLGLGGYLWLAAIWAFLALAFLDQRGMSPNSSMQPTPTSGAADAGR